MFNEQQRKRLLKIARDSIENYLKKGKKLDINVEDTKLKSEQGAFVTLKKHGELRGCIGRIESDSPLYLVVSNMAVQSATGDPRFPCLKKEEIGDITIEISVMSKPREMENIDEIEIGTHGLIVRKGAYSGLLLPQVATEYNWGKKEFLENTCYKAGLPKNAWKDAKVYKFSAEVFGE